MIRFAEENETPILKEIWHACFDDDETYVNSYYLSSKQLARHLVYCVPESKIVAMLDILPIKIKIGEKIFRASYIYAVATLPEFQGRGIMHTLLSEACRILKEDGNSFALLIPQTEPLIDFYKKQGFTLPIYKRVSSYETKEKTTDFLGIYPCSEEDFIKEKTACENKRADAILHSELFLRCAYHQTLAAGGSILKIPQTGYAVCYPEKDTLFVQELSCEDKCREGVISALGGYFGKNLAKVQEDGKDKLYGLAKTLDSTDEVNLSGVYMSAMLD